MIIVLPALVVGVIEVVSDTLLDSAISFPLDAIVMTLVVLAIAAALSGTAYRRIDSLRATLAARNRELEERAASASALRRVSVAITALADLPEIVDAVVENARTLIGVDAAILLLADGEGRSRYATSSDPTGAIDRSGGLPNPGSDDVLRYLPAELALGRLVAPLQRGRETIGLLAVGSRVERSFDVDDVETLASLADQAAIAIEHARLQDRLRELAVESERERIAREMHDGLAQVLGYVSTKSQAVEELLATGRVDAARAQMAELGAAARSLYVDVREAILGLRSPISPGIGLVGAIEDYGARFADAAKVGVSVVASPAARDTHLRPATEANVFRIVQESLTNVRKHAGAGRVVIRVEREKEDLHLQIADDGRGFPTAPGTDRDWPRYGQAAMRERAAAIGARIAWSNGVDGGAVVTLDVPIASPAAAVAS
ncbi:MAG TPA: histidine kinase [Candidatus Limnocylindrales bacterium]